MMLICTQPLVCSSPNPSLNEPLPRAGVAVLVLIIVRPTCPRDALGLEEGAPGAPQRETVPGTMSR